MNDLERARAFFAGDRYATEATGIIIEEIGPNYAKTSLRLKGHHRNAVGGVMGGVFFTMADFTFAVATNFDQPAPTVTTVAQMSCFSQPKGETLIAESHLKRDGRHTCFYEIAITDDLGNAIASVTFTGAHLSETSKNGTDH